MSECPGCLLPFVSKNGVCLPCELYYRAACAPLYVAFDAHRTPTRYWTTADVFLPAGEPCRLLGRLNSKYQKSIPSHIKLVNKVRYWRQVESCEVLRSVYKNPTGGESLGRMSPKQSQQHVRDRLCADLLDKQNGCCFYCDARINELFFHTDSTITFGYDHSNAGQRNSYCAILRDINAVVICCPVCNFVKGGHERTGQSILHAIAQGRATIDGATQTPQMSNAGYAPINCYTQLSSRSRVDARPLTSPILRETLAMMVNLRGWLFTGHCKCQYQRVREWFVTHDTETRMTDFYCTSCNVCQDRSPLIVRTGGSTRNKV